MEACKICVEPCRACGMDPHDPRCGICGMIHEGPVKHTGTAYSSCGRCGRKVSGDRLNQKAPAGGG